MKKKFNRDDRIGGIKSKAIKKSFIINGKNSFLSLSIPSFLLISLNVHDFVKFASVFYDLFRSMKIFCFSFIVYLLVLSWQPCNDLTAKFSSCESKSFTETTHLSETETPDEPDDCSPFCICSCRQISTVYTNLNFIATSALIASFENAPEISYQNPYSHQNLDLIWQPPKFDFTV